MEKIKCPECKKKLSSKAVMCPKCGCPVSRVQVNEFPMEETNDKKRRLFTVVISIVGIVAVVLTVIFMFCSNSSKANLKTIDDAMVKIVCYDPLDNIISTGSGFFYKSSWHVVTNYHVIDGAYRIECITNDDRRENVDYIFYCSPEMDIAVLSVMIPPDYYKHLEAGAYNVEKGKKVFAIGSPLGIKNVLSEGIVSGKYMIDGINAIQFTAPISSGSSGGALVDERGRVIGITFASNEAGQNINLAIPIELLDKACSDLEQSMKLQTLELYNQYHPWGYDIGLLKIINKDIQVVTFDELKKNTELYKGKTVAFEAYVSSIHKAASVYYFMTDEKYITRDSEYDLLEYYLKGVEDSPYICVQTFGNGDYLDHMDDIEYGSKVWVIASNMENEYNFYSMLLLYDEKNLKYVSSVPSIGERILEK